MSVQDFYPLTPCPFSPRPMDDRPHFPLIQQSSIASAAGIQVSSISQAAQTSVNLPITTSTIGKLAS
jgi:hypothetical protein